MSYKIYVNDEPYLMPRNRMTAGEIKAHCCADIQYSLMREVPDGPDTFYHDWGETIPLEGEPHFLTIPPATFG